MTSQVIKHTISNTLLFEFLDKICHKHNNKYYILNNISFKLSEYHNLTETFFNQIIDNYYSSKQYYLTRKLNYSKFTTIIRQICKSNNIHFTSKIIYDKCNYDITYYIYFNNILNGGNVLD